MTELEKEDTDEISITVNHSEDPEEEAESDNIRHLLDQLAQEKEKTKSLEEKLKHTLADFQNLQKKTDSDIERGVNANTDKILVDFLEIYDDFVRARTVAAENKIVTDGLDSILKSMDALLSKCGVTPIDSIGVIFNPNFHEAISVSQDDTLDDNAITKEIRKGYISHQRVIRPALVEISKRSES